MIVKVVAVPELITVQDTVFDVNRENLELLDLCNQDMDHSTHCLYGEDLF